MLRSILQNSTAGFYIFASDSTTPTSGKTGLTITTTLSKAGASANSVSPTITEIGNGLYWIAPIAAHRDTLGEIAWQFSGTGAIIAPRLEKVVAVNDQTARFGASDGTGVTLAANQDVRNVSGTVPDSSGTTSLLLRLTSTRAGNLDLLDVAISTLQSQITALNNLSAKCNWFGSLLLEIPDSGSRAYMFELVVKDDEDKLVNLDAAPTITLTNSAGTDRSSLITTGIASVATGRYTLTITVGTSTTNEALTLRATGTVSGETRYAVLTTQVVDYDSATLINSIYTRLGAPAGASIAADIADLPTVAEFEARSIAAASYATASALSSLAARVPAALVDGRMDCSVGAMASAVLTAAAIASGAFNGKGDWRTALTLKGSLTETQVLNLIMAALIGKTSQPSGTTETFKHLDNSDAFTTTFDSNGNRTGVAIA